MAKINVIKLSKAFLGFVWVGIFASFGIAMFMSLGSWMDRIIKGQGIEVLPKFNGGKVIQEIDRKDYALHIHEPVYDGVFAKSAESYVQIDWLAPERLPEQIHDEIDYNQDGTADLKITIDTARHKLSCEFFNDRITGLVEYSSFADFRLKADPDLDNVLFDFRNFKYGDLTYQEGLAIKLILNP